MNTTIIIERGIPIPPLRGPSSRWNEVLSAMKKGDSVHLPYDEGVKLQNYMRNHGVHPVMRQTTPRGTNYSHQMVRVWHNGELTEEEKKEKSKRSHERVKKWREVNGIGRRI